MKQMKRVGFGFGFGRKLALGVAFVSLSTSAVHAAPNWNTQMKRLSTTLSTLLADVYSDARYNDPKNYPRIRQNAQTLATLAHTLPSDSKTSGAAGAVVAAPTDADLSVGLVAHLFQAEADRAVRELKRGNRDYARSVLKTLPTFCVGCHTRSGGTDLSGITLASPKLDGLFTTFERAQFFVGARRFDDAMKLYLEVLSDQKFAKTRPLDWERAARQALAVAVRVKKDPALSLQVVSRLTDPAPGITVPKFVREDALAWKKSLEAWKSESPSKPLTEEGLFAEARRIFAQIGETQKFAADRSADALYLRLSAVLHDQLKIAPNGPRAAEGLLLLGVSYESLRNLELWELQDLYYEACVRKSPHTDTAAACFRRYEQSQYTGFSGSGGMALPPDVQSRLAELKALSEPKAPANQL